MAINNTELYDNITHKDGLTTITLLRGGMLDYNYDIVDHKYGKAMCWLNRAIAEIVDEYNSNINNLFGDFDRLYIETDEYFPDPDSQYPNRIDLTILDTTVFCETTGQYYGSFDIPDDELPMELVESEVIQKLINLGAGHTSNPFILSGFIRRK